MAASLSVEGQVSKVSIRALHTAVQYGIFRYDGGDVVGALCGKKGGIRDAFSEFRDIDHSTTPSPPSSRTSPPPLARPLFQFEHPGIDSNVGTATNNTCRTAPIPSKSLQR